MKKLLFLFLTLFAFTAYAGGYDRPDTCCTTATSESGSDATAYAAAEVNLTVAPTETNTINNAYWVRTYDDDKVDSMAAQFSAIANIPELNHRSGSHNHTGVGVGIGMAGDEFAGAFGITHHLEENVVLKASTAFSEEYRNTYGVGASIAW